MARIASGTALVALVGVIAGCAHVPDATLSYYLARSKVSFKVVRTVACDKLNVPIVVNSVTPAVAHFADRSALPQTIKTADFKNPFADTDVKVEFYSDGRLKGLNSTTTGQGEAILKSVISIAAAAAAAKSVKALPTFPDQCKIIAAASGGKTLTLTYEGEVDPSAGPEKEQPIKGVGASAYYAQELEPAIGRVCAFVTSSREVAAPVTPGSSTSATLKARQPRFVEFTVYAGVDDKCQADRIWLGELPVAHLGTEYSIPVAKAAAFGKQTFVIGFDESGAIATVQFQATTGAPQVLNVIGSALSAVQGQAAAKAEAANAEADLIAAQQRLAECLANKADCK